MPKTKDKTVSVQLILLFLRSIILILLCLTEKECSGLPCEEFNLYCQ